MVFQVLGTESDSGKTQIVSALINIFGDFKPFPFKAQNMSLNSYVGVDNGEMAFAQAYQSLVSGTQPVTLSNPVLLKPVGRGRTEVIFMGKSKGIFKAEEYWFNIKSGIKEDVFSVFSSVLKEKEFVIVEGAGSCTEMNLKENDFSNLPLSTTFKIPFILVADIERGGVFAKVVGSYELMTKEERELMIGVIINKMSGDISLLKEGVNFLERKIGKRVLGVIPYVDDILLPEEDSMMFLRNTKFSANKPRKLKIRVIRTKYISNFSDFYPLQLDSKYNDDIDFAFAFTPQELEPADIVIIPGSRNVFCDLDFIKETGFFSKVIELSRKGRLIFGICGGYEMFFEKIRDDFGIEGNGETEGFGFIKGTIEFEKEKKVFWEEVDISTPWFSGKIKGYNIRHGVSPEKYYCNKNIFGTFLHGIFWNNDFRKGIYKFFGVDYKNEFPETFSKEISIWSKIVSDSVDIDFIKSEIGL